MNEYHFDTERCVDESVNLLLSQMVFHFLSWNRVGSCFYNFLVLIADPLMLQEAAAFIYI